MKSIQKKLATLLVSVLFAGVAIAESRYITDVIYVPMRAGPGNQYKIVHQGIKTGTKMTVLEESAGDGYSKVVTPGGLGGYIRTQYLLKNPPAKLQLPDIQASAVQAIKDRDELSAQLKDSKAEIKRVTGTLQDTSKKLDTETSELKKIQAVSADTLAIDQRNKQLIEDNQQLKSRVQVLETNNHQLVQNKNFTWFLYGGGTILMGILLGLVLPRIKVQKKQSGDWV